LRKFIFCLQYTMKMYNIDEPGEFKGLFESEEARPVSYNRLYNYLESDCTTEVFGYCMYPDYLQG